MLVSTWLNSSVSLHVYHIASASASILALTPESRGNVWLRYHHASPLQRSSCGLLGVWNTCTESERVDRGFIRTAIRYVRAQAKATRSCEVHKPCKRYRSSQASHQPFSYSRGWPRCIPSLPILPFNVFSINPLWNHASAELQDPPGNLPSLKNAQRWLINGVCVHTYR